MKGIDISPTTWKIMRDSETGVSEHPAYVANFSDHVVYFKPEESYGNVENDGAYPILPHTQLYAEMDGVSCREIRESAVYKVPNGNLVWVLNSKMVTFPIPTNNPIKYGFSAIYDRYKGGWYTESPGGDEDKSWDKLFDKSK